jgi:hypothetical protein
LVDSTTTSRRAPRNALLGHAVARRRVDQRHAGVERAQQQGLGVGLGEAFVAELAGAESKRGHA